MEILSTQVTIFIKNVFVKILKFNLNFANKLSCIVFMYDKTNLFQNSKSEKSLDFIFDWYSFLFFNTNTELLSSTSSPDTVRGKLEEIMKIMLAVWAKQGIALKVLSGKSSGNFLLC